MIIERPNIEPEEYYTALEAGLLLEVNEQTLLKWSRDRSSGIRRFRSQKDKRLIRFKGWDLLKLWEGEEM